MKKLLIAATAFLGLLSMDVDAQETKFGVKAGVNLANLTGDDIDDTDMAIGFHVGGFAHLGINDVFAIQPELLFDSKGASSSAGDEDVKLTLNYISIPVLAKFNVTDELSFHAGPQVGILMSADLDGDDVKDNYKSTDFGLAAGAGYQLESGLNFNLRYAMSLSTIGEEYEETYVVNPVTGETATTTVDAGDIKNSVIMISVGYAF